MDSFLLSKANRLVAGAPVSMSDVYGIFLISAIFVVFGFTGKHLNSKIKMIRMLIISLAFCYVSVKCNGYAGEMISDNQFARVSFSSGYWLFFLGVGLFFMQGHTQLNRPTDRVLFSALMFLPLIVLVFKGGIDNMSVMLEYANYEDRFRKEIIAHILISFGSIVLAVFAGVPLGIISSRRSAHSGKLFNILNIIQTIPSIALFGFLMIPFAWLASKSTVLESAGVAGIGWAPAVTALFLYSLLPIVRNTYEGVSGISEGVRDAAMGMGMTNSYMLLKVELPLSMPVILNGVRVALVQSIGNTAVVSLIGAGGMGIFIFQGLGQSAVPLIMLGTIPTIFLAVAADSVMHLIISLSRSSVHDRA